MSDQVITTQRFNIDLHEKNQSISSKAVNCKAVNGKIRFIAKTIFAKNV
jgi:hypothetical protein